MQGSPGQQCQAGAAGNQGAKGGEGPAGPTGIPGPRAQILTVPASEVFGALVPDALQQLVAYSESRSH